MPTCISDGSAQGRTASAHQPVCAADTPAAFPLQDDPKTGQLIPSHLHVHEHTQTHKIKKNKKTTTQKQYNTWLLN